MCTIAIIIVFFLEEYSVVQYSGIWKLSKLFNDVRSELKLETIIKIPENIMFIHIVNVTNSLLQVISCILDLLELPRAILIDRGPADSVHLP